MAFVVLGFLAVLVSLEGVLRLLSVSSGLRPPAAIDAWPLRPYDSKQPYTYSYGWAMLNPHRGATYNYGHIAPHDFRAASRPLIVVGDSFVESLMNEYGDTVQGILGQRLGANRPVYGLGVSGLSASDYIAMARRARAEFAPSAAVFVMTDGDIAESLLPRPGGYHLQPMAGDLALAFTPLSPSAAMQWVRRGVVGDFALYDYLRGNLKFAPGDFVKGLHAAHPAPPTPQLLAMRDRAAKDAALWFLRELPGASGVAPECTVLLIDADRYAMYAPRAASPSKDGAELRRLLIERGQALGFHVVDLGPQFAAEYARTRLKVDHWPVDRHWNQRGHAVAADAVMAALYSGARSSACMPGEGSGEK